MKRPVVVATVVTIAMSLIVPACASKGESRTADAGRTATTGSVPAAVPDGPDWERRQGEAALALVRYPWPRLGYRITFRADANDGVVAVNYPDRRHIEVSVRRGMSLLDLAHVIAHELGHAYDVQYNDDRIRNEWKAARGFPDRAGWVDANAGEDFGLPGGDYAEVFAYWALGGRGLFKSELAPVPSPPELERLAKKFFRVR